MMGLSHTGNCLLSCFCSMDIYPLTGKNNLLKLIYSLNSLLEVRTSEIEQYGSRYEGYYILFETFYDNFHLDINTHRI